MKQSLTYLALALVVLGASFAGSLALRSVFAFTEPAAPPPSGNVPIPINVSATAQTKTGALTIQNDLSARRFCSVDSPTLCVDLTGTTTLGGNIDLGGVGSVVNYTTGYVPTQPGDLATKAYVDSKIPQPSTSGNKFVFASSATYDGSMSKGVSDTLSGLSLGNKRCGDLAAAAGINGTYKAWLSTSTVTAKSNIFCDNTKAYFRTDGAAIASSCADLTDGSIGNPIKVNEKLQTIASGYETWTGVLQDGISASYYPASPYPTQGGYCFTKQLANCQDWTNPSSANTGAYGSLNAINFNWSWGSLQSSCSNGSSYITGQYMNELNCNTTAHIYCFQI